MQKMVIIQRELITSVVLTLRILYFSAANIKYLQAVALAITGFDVLQLHIDGFLLQELIETISSL